MRWFAHKAILILDHFLKKQHDSVFHSDNPIKALRNARASLQRELAKRRYLHGGKGSKGRATYP